jgi:hypothetical protein
LSQNVRAGGDALNCHLLRSVLSFGELMSRGAKAPRIFRQLERVVRVQAGGLERFENSADLLLEDRNIVLNGKPNLFDIDTEIVMNQLVAHPGDIIPRNVFTVLTNFIRKPLCCLPDNFNLTNCSILEPRYPL